MRRATALVVFCLPLCTVAHAGTIDVNGSSTLTVGFPATVYGETFVVPAPTNENVLIRFSLTFLGTGTYHALLYQWSGNSNDLTGNPVGAALFDSGPMQAPPSLTQVSFNTGGIALNPASAYVAFINSSNLQGYEFSVSFFNPYPDGLGPVRTSLSDFTTPGSWSASSATDDLAFTADFVAPASVPEPGTSTLLLASVAVIAVARTSRPQAS